MIVSLRVRMILLMVVAADLMIFSRITLLPLIAMAIGIATTLLGIVSSYRIASVIGLLVVSTTAAASIKIPSLLDLGVIVTSIVGLLLPLQALLWLALSAEEGEMQQVSLKRRPAMTTLLYTLVCLWSAPLVVLLMSFFTPTIAVRVDILAEISIILLTTVAGTALLLRAKLANVESGMPEAGTRTA